MLARQKVRIVLAGLLFTVIVYVMLIHDFLAVTKPVRAEVLVVEGWIWNEPALQEALAEFERGAYQWVVCVGGPEKAGVESSADLAAKRLVELGIDKRLVHVLSVSDGIGHRTLGSALAVRAWLRREKLEVTAVNVFTLGVHARKSYVLFKKAFGPGFDVGIIAGTESDYKVERWWASQCGIYQVLRSTVGYLYALAWSPAAESPHQ